MTTKIDQELTPECSCCSCCETREQSCQEESGIHSLKSIRIGIGIVLFLTTFFLKIFFPLKLIVYISSYLLIGGDILFLAVRNIIRGQIFDENFLMGLATVGAFAIGEYPEAVAVMLFYQVGEYFQERAIHRSRRSIAALMDIRPDFAHLKQNGEINRVSPEAVRTGDIIIVKPGEKIPLDGKIIEGSSLLDTSALTGESALREVAAGSEILSGSINTNGLLTIEVTKEFGQSTVSKILDLVQNAGAKKAQTENFITKFAKYYTPAVVFAAIALAFIPPFIIPGTSFGIWINRALVFLVVSCPCALVISIPLSFFGGIGGASRNGILIKGSNYLEALNNVDTVVFDKTGTLTQGVFQVTKIHNNSDFSENDLLEYAAYSESYSNHPIALSVRKAYGKDINQDFISDYSEISGQGVRASVNGKTILAGNARLMEKEAIPYEKVADIGTAVHIAIDGYYAGYILISDEIKQDSAKTVSQLRALGVQKLVMLTGDSKTVGEMIGSHLGMDQIYSELLPAQKVDKLERLEDEKSSSKGKLVFMGDGINDAPVLARADVGVAMGGVGSDAAIEAADIVLMTDEPSKIITAIKIAKKTRLIVVENIYLALGVKGIVLLLGALGLANMWEAVFADVGVALLAVLNAMRVLKTKNI
jgi:Cd2+/Zn2+-exporting ATPase